MQILCKLTAAALVLLFAGPSLAAPVPASAVVPRSPIPGAGRSSSSRGSSTRSGGGNSGKDGPQTIRYGRPGGDRSKSRKSASSRTAKNDQGWPETTSGPSGSSGYDRWGFPTEQMKKEWLDALARNFPPSKPGDPKLPPGASAASLSPGGKRIWPQG
ncbi:hypothetical protein JDV02_003212 [Purpureocillium takamizusanense]|uniref:Uncharacterized protein n=1 Tax=Purpureocillium takamizusanense TaxID=2060973 RepID=A0A9Q8QCN4_9HYPO|nr:uncharacterized protein JDV02_003212 [Purpureocillium takamizusanense]UNI16812.1 hypothetical protein JDV02_003212 [Purpureocillium takamizusanense]